MTLFLKVSGAVLLSIILVLALKSNAKEVSAVLAISVICLTALAALNYLRPVMDFIIKLEQLGELDESMIEILLKATGIGIVTEVTNLVCKDAGNESMGKAVQLLGTSVILYLSMPLFYALIELLQKILGEL